MTHKSGRLMSQTLCGAYIILIQFYSVIHCNTYCYNVSALFSTTFYSLPCRFCNLRLMIDGPANFKKALQSILVDPIFKKQLAD